MYNKMLFEFFSKNFSDDEIEDIMEKTRSLYYLTEFFPHNIRLKAIKKLKLVRQKEINNLIYNEIRLLEEKAAEKGIFPVHIKGITLSHQLFGERSERFFKDMDLFVKYDDIIPFLNILKEAGYTTADDTEIDPIGEEKNKKLVHLRPFYKRINESNRIKIEIHTTPFFMNAQSYESLAQEKVNEFHNYTRDFKLNEINVKVFSPEVNLLILLDHFMKHILYIVVETYFSRLNKEIEVLVGKLYEAKLFYEKYKNEIDPETMKNVAEIYNSKMVIMLAIKYLKEVFHDTDLYLWDEPSSMEDLFRFEDCICYILMKNFTLADILRYKNLIIGKIFEKFEYMPGLKLRIPYKTPGISGKHFSICQQNVINRYGTHLFMGNCPENEKELSLWGNLSWNEKFLFFNARLNDINFPEEKGNLLTIAIDDRQKKYPVNMKVIFVRFLINNENKSDDIYYYDLVLDGFGRISEKCDFSWSGEPGSGLSLSLSIPWDILKINPRSGLKLGLNINVANFHGYQVYRVMNLSGTDERIIPFYFAELELGGEVPYIFS